MSKSTWGRLTGRQTIYQMIEFAENIAARGGAPKEPLEYKHIYLGLLLEKIRHRPKICGKAAPLPKR